MQLKLRSSPRYLNLSALRATSLFIKAAKGLTVSKTLQKTQAGGISKGTPGIAEIFNKLRDKTQSSLENSGSPPPPTFFSLLKSQRSRDNY